MTGRKNVLVLYYTRGVWPLRDTIRTHLYCWRHYGRHRAFYVNVAFGFPERLLDRIRFDAVILHTIYLSMRWSPAIFAQYTGLCASIVSWDCTKIAMPQDEFIHTGLLDGYLDETGVQHVLTCAEPDDWPTIYPRMTAKGARFRTILTGYLDEHTVERIDGLAAEVTERRIDIGYRAWRAQYWLGEHGMLKVWLAERFAKAAAEGGLTADISVEEADVLNGDDWFRFLLECRTTPGVEGGASLCDHDGAIKARVEAYLETHPDAPFEEVRDACFPDADGTLGLACLSPRHLEACATRTCQLLVRGHYNGLLVADRHYIPVEPDWSNLDEVIAKVRDDALVADIARNAYEDVIANPVASYRHFVHEIERDIIDAPDGRPHGRAPGPGARIAMALLALRDRFHWWFIRLETLVMREGTSSLAGRARQLLYAAVLKWILPRV